MAARRRYVILYSTVLHAWEVWSQGRPVAQGALAACQQAYPQAPPQTEQQFRLERNDETAPGCGGAARSEALAPPSR